MDLKKSELRQKLGEPLNALFEGYSFIPSGDHWRLSKDVQLSLKWIRGSLPKDIGESYRIVLAELAKKYAAGTVARFDSEFRNFVKWAIKQKGRFTEAATGELLGYRQHLGARNESALHSVSFLLRYWHSRRLPGVADSVIILLGEWRIRGGIKGLPVRIRCPNTGPLTDIEFEALHTALSQAYERGEMELDAFALTMLFVATGRRPRQLGDLKSKDLQAIAGIGGRYEYFLDIPRIKQRSGSWRAEFRGYALGENMAWLVNKLLEINRARLLKIIPDASKELFQELPLFPLWREITATSGEEREGVLATMKTIYYHKTTDSLRKMVRDCTDLLKVQSDRIPGPIRIFPTRLRRTIGTRAAREGYGPLIIAELLDHTDTQNVKVYAEDVPENVDAINLAVAKQLAPMAQAFSGVLIDHESQAKRGDDLSSRVRTRGGKVAGNCGHYGFCGALAPIACYTCLHFQPWIDGPHEEILRRLNEENKNIRKQTGDSTIASISNRTMLAIAEVVRRCKLRRAALKMAK